MKRKTAAWDACPRFWAPQSFLWLRPGPSRDMFPGGFPDGTSIPPFLGFTAFRFLGVLLIAAGIPALLESFGRFALQGIGTPAPVFPTRHLVVKGFYCYVRNPMYVAVVSLILGQALLFGDASTLAYGIFIWLAMHLFVVIYEEPTLRKSFRAEYEVFCTHVPRWVPRVSPWRVGRQDK